MEVECSKGSEGRIREHLVICELRFFAMEQIQPPGKAVTQ